MPAIYDKTIKRWRYQLHRHVDGQRVRVNKVLPAGWGRAEAEAYDREHTARILAEVAGIAPDRRGIAEAIAAYLKERAPQLKNRKQLVHDFALMHGYYAGQPMSALPDVARAYAADNADRLAPATISKRIAYLRAACRYGWRVHRIGTHDPRERVQAPPVRNERQVYASRSEVLMLARAAGRGALRACIMIAFYSGMRRGEILTATVRSGAFWLADTKNGEPRAVPVHPRLTPYLRRMPMAVSPNTLGAQYARVRAVCGMEWLRFHDLRHSAASAMINAGVDLYTVGAVLGHRAGVSTKRYAHLAHERLADAVGKIGKAA